MRTNWTPPTKQAATTKPKTWEPTGDEVADIYTNSEDSYVVVGTPAEDSEHDCDAMGCGSASDHILYRFKVQP